ncbi:helix-turn-helix transcriptional regulator [Paenibacillus septentrionalis]|uniref:Helix-turn-helix transcriptional regulator n=1 Tax=Paenibacillus septentrionalis TaxID=429342 RepID=A0ABW1UX22_9BACL
MHEDEFYRWLGRYIKELRKKKNRTQQDICYVFRLSRSSLSNIETGRHRLSIFALYELLCVLDEPFEKVIDSMVVHHRHSKL